MSILFSGSELINIAIGIERRGITFYDIMARSADSETARRVFGRLADMERDHIKIFQDMLGEADKYRPEGTTREYADYFQALVENSVFTEDMITSETSMQTDSDIKALELGIMAEKDSILFYYQLRDVMSPRALPIIDRVIAEEKSHLSQLSGVKKELA